jgi:outer membrane protein OmpA-like peptidoglycan-associated protein
MLATKGYGDARPLAPNDTEEGKFRNRRIEFSLQ